MRRALIAALVAAVLPARAGEDTWRERWSEDGLEVGGSVVVDLLHATRAGNWPVRLDLSAWLEADLGALTGWAPLDHSYVFALPTLAWGEEEDWGWRARLYVAWLKWDGSEKWNILAGLYDPTWDFHSLPSAAPFLRLPSRVGGEFAPGSPGLLDLYPLAAPAIRIEIKPRRHLAIQAAALALDGDYELHGRRAVEDAGGARRPLLLAEVAWSNTEEESEESGAHFKAGLGGWLLAAQTSWGVYAFADTTLWREPASTEQGCSAFASGSVAGGDGRAAWRASGGVTWCGLFPHRDADVTAVAIIHEPRTDSAAARTAWEVLHRVPLSEACWLQFTVQQQAAADWRFGVTFGWEL